MVYFRDRHLVYKVGFGGLLASTVAYIVGFACPFWVVLKLENFGLVDQTVGLWQACIQGTFTCVSNMHSNNPPWINAARALSCITLILFFIVIFAGCYRNITKIGQANCNTPGRYLEVVTILAVLIGSIGVIIFAAEFHKIYMSHYNIGDLYWAFGVVCAALGVAGISSLFMFAFHIPKAPRRRHTATIRARGSNGRPVTIQFSTDPENGTLHLPYFGDISPDQLVHGAVPVLPPSYESVTSGSEVNYPNPPTAGSEAPPSYEDITKDFVPPPELVDRLDNTSDKERRNVQ